MVVKSFSGGRMNVSMKQLCLGYPAAEHTCQLSVTEPLRPCQHGKGPHGTPCPSLVPQITPNAAESVALSGQDSLGGYLHS